MQPHLINRDQLALSELLDRALNKGVVLWGDATISVAGVDLIYVGLKVLLASVDTAERLKHDARTTTQGCTGAAE
jgi:gas vesicle structural protein